MTTIKIDAENKNKSKEITTSDVEKLESEIEETLQDIGLTLENITVNQEDVRVGEKVPVGYLTTDKSKWIELSEDYTSSTIAYFEGGYKHSSDPIEVRFWTLPSTIFGITKDGEVVTDWDKIEEYDLVYRGEGYSMGHEPQDIVARKLRYYVNLLETTEGTSLDSIRTKNPEEAVQKLKERYENGEYDTEF